MQHAVMKMMLLLLQRLLDYHVPLHLSDINTTTADNVTIIDAAAVCSVKISGGGISGGSLFHAMFHACRVCCALTVALVGDMAKRWISKRYIQQ
jgi:hypothetical protein